MKFMQTRCAISVADGDWKLHFPVRCVCSFSNSFNRKGLFHSGLLRLITMVNGFLSYFFDPFLSREIVPSSGVNK
jgi:hypothetical protein